MKSGFFKFLQHRPEVKLNKKVYVFIVCLLISFFSWLQINLSKKHNDILPVKIQFTHLPKTRFGTTKITDTLFVEVEANGYDLLKYEMKEVLVDFKKIKKDFDNESYYFLPNLYTKTIGKQLGGNIFILRAMTDTVQLKPFVR